ncbi:Cytochrome b/c1 [Terricaulis silvestris]|uniref:Cytochrome b n=1 Tax=Terricaulis silvestris TaxID=2686094 RepID=A0A6I6MQQ8_9CAUL|nr:Cytochrome b/c1 [Terricaulis silvestris]
MSSHFNHGVYEPQSGFTRWLDKRLPILRLSYDSFVAYPVPRNLNYWWTFGAMLAMCLVVQIVTGIVLAMHYIPHVSMAFASVQRIDRDVPFGWLIQNIHSVGASMFFLAVYIHMFRGLYYGSYKAPRELLWILGCIIYLLMVVTGFLGYTLPWGQMSFWGATVITNILGAVPLVGESIQVWIRGGAAIDQPTLNRFFSLHYLLPFVIVGVVGLHIWALHEAGQNNPTGVDVKSKADTVPFSPHATMKDLFATVLFVILFAVFVFYLPNALGHADNFIPANPLQTPPEIVPEWYLLPFYAILRAFDFNIGPIDSKLAGVIAMFASIAVLFILPWIDTSRVRSMRYRPIARQFFLIFVVACLVLGWCGGQNPGLIIAKPADFSATLTWTQGGQVVTRAFNAPSEAQFDEAAEAARTSIEGATQTSVIREGATAATVTGVVGGQMQTETLNAGTIDELEAEISAYKSEIGAAAPFFSVERRTPPLVFTVTTLSQIATFYYFFFFLVLLPLLGLRERPSRVPDTIAKPVIAEQGAA